MRKYIFLICSILVLFLIQGAWLRAAEGRIYLIPQLLLIFVIIYAMTHSFPETLWTAFFCGFLLEIWSAMFFGAYIFSFIALASGVYFLTRNLTIQEVKFWPSIFFVILSVPTMIIFLSVYQKFFVWIGLGTNFSVSELWSLNFIYLIILNLVFYPVLKLIMKLLPEDERPL